jgi:mono/diheme cytochrome c family protein
MRRWPRLLAITGLAAGAAPFALRAEAGAQPGVYDADQAHVDYMLKCQGCHRPDGSGDDRSNPPMRGVVARFLSVPGGREFLGRVPGVATTNLDDARLANLVNWTLYRFDAGHMPANFRPYTPAELGKLRQDPLRLDRVATRTRLVAGFAPDP